MAHPYKGHREDKAGAKRAKHLVKSAGYAEGGPIDQTSPRFSRQKDVGGGGIGPGTSNVTPMRGSLDDLKSRLGRLSERGMITPSNVEHTKDFVAARLHRAHIDPLGSFVKRPAPYRRGGRSK